MSFWLRGPGESADQQYLGYADLVGTGFEGAKGVELPVPLLFLPPLTL